MLLDYIVFKYEVKSFNKKIVLSLSCWCEKSTQLKELQKKKKNQKTEHDE